MKTGKKVITVIGLGSVGLASAVGFALRGHEVKCIELDEAKINSINSKVPPMYEKDLVAAFASVHIDVTTDYECILPSDITFICVETPSNEDGSISLVYIEKAARQIADVLKRKNGYHLVVVKSTVVPTATEKVIIPIFEAAGKLMGKNLGICTNPEFLRQGSALSDFLNSARVVIGEYDKKSGDILEKLYQGFNAPILRVDLKTAEMIKYASNTFLATKISLINEIGNICKKLGIDAYEVAKGMGYDSRIGSEFLNAGLGFGGSCLPKDLRALIAASRELGFEPKLLEAALNLNEEQPTKMIELLKRHIPDLRGKDIGLLGLAFKANTDDVRESRTIRIVDALLAEGARIKAYDPVAMENFRRLFPQIEYATCEEVLQCAAILILTNWQEFENLDYKGKTVIDGRRILKAKGARIYEGLCW